MAAAHLGCNAPGVPRILAVDWSGARTGELRSIWLAEARDGRTVRLEGGRYREQLVAKYSAMGTALALSKSMLQQVQATIAAYSQNN